MNGISSNLKEELKKTSNSKHKDRLKFFATIIVTNALVALICLPSERSISEKKEVTSRTVHTNHKMLILPLTLLLSIADEEKEIPVTLISKTKKIIVKKAFLHTKENNSLSRDGEASRFKIEIPESELETSRVLLEEEMIAVPYVENKKIYKSVNYQGSKYEINL